MDNCLAPESDCSLLYRDFALIKKLGEGSYGLVFLLKQIATRDDYAIKMSFNPNILDEYQKGCLLNTLTNKGLTSSFIYYYRGFECSTSPEESFFNLLDEGKNFAHFTDVVYYFIMELADGTVEDLLEIAFPKEETLCFVLELLIAFYFARSLIGFYHGDVKSDNILFKINGKSRSYKLPFVDGEITCSSRYQPKIGDLGNSWVGNILSGYSRGLNDYERIIDVVSPLLVRAKQKTLRNNLFNVKTRNPYDQTRDTATIKEAIELVLAEMKK